MNAHFLMRAQRSVKKYARIIQTFHCGDYLVEFHTSRKTRWETPGLPEVLTCRLIHFQIQGSSPSILLTSLLDPVQFPASELVELYHRRWHIETIYREWKHALEITSLRSHTPVGIAKEMHAHLLLSNLVRFVMTDAVKDTDETPLAFSFLSALTAVKTAVARMSVGGAPRAEIYADLLAEIRRSPIRQRPGRRYPRRGERTVKIQSTGPATRPFTLLRLT
jgi:IS4 transposase